MVKTRFAPVAVSLLLATMLVAPGFWSGLTSFNPSPNGALPAAGPAGQDTPGGMPNPGSGTGANRLSLQGNAAVGGGDQGLLNYLLTNTRPGTYLLATDRASNAATYILATGRPILTFGGFLGQYNEVSVDQLAALVKSGRLRFILSQALQGHQEIAQWVQKNCTQVDISISNTSGTTSSPLAGSWPNQALYDCGG
jgi:4-amino-4-deoxy-L-arabinose transferase-like glycosyltransferase